MYSLLSLDAERTERERMRGDNEGLGILRAQEPCIKRQLWQRRAIGFSLNSPKHYTQGTAAWLFNLFLSAYFEMYHALLTIAGHDSFVFWKPFLPPSTFPFSLMAGVHCQRDKVGPPACLKEIIFMWEDTWTVGATIPWLGSKIVQMQKRAWVEWGAGEQHVFITVSWLWMWCEELFHTHDALISPLGGLHPGAMNENKPFLL